MSTFFSAFNNKARIIKFVYFIFASSPTSTYTKCINDYFWQCSLFVLISGKWFVQKLLFIKLLQMNFSLTRKLGTARSWKARKSWKELNGGRHGDDRVFCWGCSDVRDFPCERISCEITPAGPQRVVSVFSWELIYETNYIPNLGESCSCVYMCGVFYKLATERVRFIKNSDSKKYEISMLASVPKVSWFTGC